MVEPKGPRRMDSRHVVTEIDRRGWHLDKTVSISHLITTLTIAGSVFVWASNMEQRIVVLETRMENASVVATDTQRDVRELAQVVRDEIRMLRMEVRDAVKLPGGRQP